MKRVTQMVLNVKPGLAGAMAISAAGGRVLDPDRVGSHLAPCAGERGRAGRGGNPDANAIHPHQSGRGHPLGGAHAAR